MSEKNLHTQEIIKRMFFFLSVHSRDLHCFALVLALAAPPRRAPDQPRHLQPQGQQPGEQQRRHQDDQALLRGGGGAVLRGLQRAGVPPAAAVQTQ